jgi:multidrug efflux pump subunit AcrA (membrane-fusion protein)
MRADILTEEDREATMIPKTAVLSDGEDSVVFFIRDPLDGKGKARRMRLETGIEDDNSIECRNSGAQGLRPGDLIIVSGQQDLKDQTEVEISKD